MAKFLPDSAVACSEQNNRIFLYIQGFNGDVIEYAGSLAGPKELYVQDRHRTATALARYDMHDRNKVRPHGPKIFTPLAAGFLKDVRYLFYLDDNNYLHDYHRGPNPGDRWVHGTLRSDTNIKAAEYSKLATTTVTNRCGTSISVYYQSPDRNGAIMLVNFKFGQPRWQKDTTRVTNPPLYGTSLAAVPPREGILVDPPQEDKIKLSPVLYLQLDSLQLAHSQGQLVRPLPHYRHKFAPHTSLAAVDPRGGLQYFYTTTEKNFVGRVIFEPPPRAEKYDILAAPSPKSTMTAICTNPRKVVLFFQDYNPKPERVELYAMTLTETEGVWDGGEDRPGTPVTLK